MTPRKPIYWLLAVVLAVAGSLYKFEDERGLLNRAIAQSVESGLNRYAETLALLARSQSVHDWSVHRFVNVESLFNQVVLGERALQGVFLVDAGGQIISRNTHNSEGLYLNEVDRRAPLQSSSSSQTKALSGKFGSLQVVKVNDAIVQLHKDIFVQDKRLGAIVATVELLPLAVSAVPQVQNPFRSFALDLDALRAGPQAFNGLSRALNYVFDTGVLITVASNAGFMALVAVLLLFCLALLVSTLLINPVRSLMQSIQNVSAGKYEQIDLTSQYGPMKWLLRLYNTQIESIAEASKLRLENESAKRLSLLAKQVSHDIRSPLMVLKMLVPSLTTTDEGAKGLLSRAIARVEEIANALLNRDKVEASFPLTSGSLSRILDEIIDEKNFEFSRHPIIIQKNIAQGLTADVNPTDFKRVVSNLINNSAEAMQPQGGAIQVRAFSEGKILSVCIEDNGKGIPPEILERLGEEGFSYGKSGEASGNGLGLYHARVFARNANGHLRVDSQLGKGTRVALEIPARL